MVSYQPLFVDGLIACSFNLWHGNRFLSVCKQKQEKSDRVYSTTLLSVGGTSLIFALFCIFFAQNIANGLGYEQYPEYVSMMGVVVAIDAFASIPFAYLRFINRPIKFAAIKFLYVVLNIVFNIFFLVACPWLEKQFPSSVNWFYNPNYGVGYIFIANILSTVIQTLVLLPYIVSVKYTFNFNLLKSILRYSLPLLILGIAGIMNQTLDKILYPFLKPGIEGAAELGICKTLQR